MGFSIVEPRHYLIAIGSPSCDNMGLGKLEKVASDVEQVTSLFRKQGYERVLSDQIRLGSTADRIKSALSSWFVSSDRKPSDYVVIYYAGHGDEGRPYHEHCLFTVESDPEDLTSTAIETRALIRSFFPCSQRSPQNVLLILDVCYANIGARQVSGVLAQLQGVVPKGCGFWTISSSDANTPAGDGTFVEALTAVMQPEQGNFVDQGEFISIDALVGQINQHFEETRQPQRAVSNSAEVQRQARFIRNPCFLVQTAIAGSLLTLLSPNQSTIRVSLQRAYAWVCPPDWCSLRQSLWSRCCVTCAICQGDKIPCSSLLRF